MSDRTGVPLELLLYLREATGSALPSPGDRLREDELAIVPFLQVQIDAGFSPTAIEHLLRVHGDCTRRMSEAEGAWWVSEMMDPAIAAGKPLNEVADTEFSDRISPLVDQAVLAMFHAQQSRIWTRNIIDGFETLLADAGIQSRSERPPAICFVDITRYTRLTEEQGDEAAAELASTLARLVQRAAVQDGGKPIKWLGDGVMLYFRDPGPAVRAAIEMVDGIAAAGLPPAHVGVHAGPVLYQEGDYFGKTVNLTARIADYARPGEVLVTQAAADASQETGVAFTDVGPVELKGVSEAVHLLRAHLA